MYVLNMDVVNSKTVLTPSAKSDLEKFILYINNKYDLENDLVLYLGDSVQGVIKNAKVLFDIIFEFDLFYLSFRKSVGIGNVIFTSENSLYNNGEAYYNARQGMDNLGSAGHLIIVPFDLMLDQLVCNQNLLLSKINKRKNLFREVFLNQDLTQVEIARKLGIDPATLSRQLASSNYKLITKNYEVLGNYLEGLYEKDL